MSASQTKKILIFSLAYLPHIGGAEVALRRIANSAHLSDIEFHVITLRFSPEEEKDVPVEKVIVHRIGSGTSYFQKILFIPLAARRALQLHHEHRFDAFWAMMSYMLFPIVLLRFAGVRLPYLLTLQEGDPFEHMFGRWFILPFRPLLSIGFKNASVVQVISTYLATWAKKMGYHGHVEVIPNGYDTGWFSDKLVYDKKVFWKNHGGAPTTGPILITTSRLVYKKAIDTIIRSLKLLPESFGLVVLGNGPKCSELRQLVHELKLESRVRLEGEEIPNTKIAGYLQASDIFIRPSRSEGMGNSFIEAMATGLPVIATQEGGIADFLFDAKRNPDKETTGWAVDKDSPEQIVEAVQDILAHPEQVARVKATAKKLVSEQYDWNLIAKNMREKVFTPLLKN